MNILKLIASDSYITVNKELIKLVGLDAAVLIGELASECSYWHQNNGITEDGYFFSTVENIEEKTSLSGHQQRAAIKKLEELNLIAVKVKGLPAKRYVKINQEQLIELFKNKDKNTLRTSSKEIKELELKKLNRNNNINNNNIINNKYNIGEASSPSENTSSNESFEEQKIFSVSEVAEPIDSIDNKATINNDATTSPEVEKPKRKSLKDQLVEYIKGTAFTEETKDILLKWVFAIGLKRNVTQEQLKDKLKKIWHDCNANEALVRESIETAYLSGWVGFFAPKQNTTPSPKTSATPLKSSDTPIVTIPQRVKLSNEIY